MLNLLFKLFGLLSKDKVIKIVIIELELLKTVLTLDVLAEKNYNGNDFPSLEFLLESLLERIGDNCSKITQLSKEIFFFIAKHSGMKPNNPSVLTLLKHLENDKGKNSLSMKHMEEKLKLLCELLKMQTNLAENILTNLIQYCVKNVEHQKNLIRELALKAIEVVKTNYGTDKLKKLLGDMPKRLETKIFP